LRFILFLAAFYLVLPTVPKAFAQDAVGAVDIVQTVTPSGSARIEIAVPVLPGGGGLKPSMSLIYTGHNSDSSLGAGWLIGGIPRISRGPKTWEADGYISGVDLVRDDAFYIDGERLVPIRTYVEVSVTKTEFRKDHDDGTIVTAKATDGFFSSFLLESKAGLTTTFVAGPTIRHDDKDVPLFFIPKRTSDRSGNYIDWVFSIDGLVATISAVRYTGFTGPNSKAPFAETRFEYEAEPKPQVKYILGQAHRRTTRLRATRTQILDASMGPTEGALGLELSYEDRATAEGSVLKTVTSVGFDGSKLPPVLMDYRKNVNSWTETPALELPISLADAPNSLGYQFARVQSGNNIKNGIIASFETQSGQVTKTFVANASGWGEEKSKVPPVLFTDVAGRSLGTILIDFDADGLTDMLQSGVGAARAFQQTKEGWKEQQKFALPISLVDSSGGALEVIRGDLDGNDQLDLLVAQNDGSAKALLNKSDGWEISSQHDLTLFSESDVFADIDCDGKFDWLQYSASGGKVNLSMRSSSSRGWNEGTIIYSVTTDTDLAPQILRPRIVGQKCPSLLIALNSDSDQFAVLLTPSPEGWVAKPTTLPKTTFWTAQRKPLSPLLADVDGDGGDDILVREMTGEGELRFTLVQRNGPEVSWDPAPTALLPPVILAQDGEVNEYIKVLDFNEDNRDDIAVLPNENEPVGQVALATGASWQRAFDFNPTTDFSQKPGKQGAVRFIDLNGDGLIDVVFNRGDSDKGALINTGTGWTLAPQWSPPRSMMRRGKVTSPVQIVDLNSDGLADLLYSYEGRSGDLVVEAFINPSRNGGEGWGDPIASYKSPEAFYSEFRGDLGWRFADLNADGRLDLIFSRTSRSGRMQNGAYSNDGTGWVSLEGFKSPVPFVIESKGYQENFDTGTVLLDVNADRLPDIVARYIDPATQNEVSGIYLNTGNGFSEFSIGAPPVRLDFNDIDKTTVQFFDFNVDGYSDILASTSSTANVYLGTGKGWTRSSRWDIPSGAKSDIFNFDAIRIMDISGDGAPDVLYNAPQRDKTNRKGVFLNTGDGWKAAPGNFAPPAAFVTATGADSGVRLIDINGDNAADVVLSAGGSKNSININPNKGVGFLADLVSSGGVKTHYNYAVLTEPAAKSMQAYEEAETPAFPIVKAIPQAPMIVSVEVEEEAGRTRNTQYKYGGLLYDLRRNQPLGFAWTEKTDSVSGLRYRTEYSQAYDLIGLPELEQVIAVHGDGAVIPIITTAKKWSVKKLTGAVRGQTNHTYAQVTQSQVIGTRQDLNGKIVARDQKDFEYDEWLNVTEMATRNANGLIITVANSYGESIVYKRFGRLTSATITHEKPGSESINRTARFSYGPQLLLASEKTEFGDDRLSLTTDYTRNTRGLIVSTTRSALGVATRQELQQWDEYGRLFVSASNAEGQKVSRQINRQSVGAAFAMPEKVFDENGLSTLISYDGFGRINNKLSSDGLSINYSRHLRTNIPSEWLLPNGGSASPGEIACEADPLANPKLGSVSFAEAVWVTSRGGKKRLESASILDQAGQLIRKIAVRTDGKKARLVFTDYSYDLGGRIIAESTPYFAGEKAPWKRYSYDRLDRRINEMSPDGACYRFEHDGRKTTRIDPLGRRSSVFMSETGKPDRVIHADGGETSFTYDVMDRVSSVTSPVGLTTEFAYDAAGNRRWTKDPDAGEMSFEFDAFGQVQRQRAKNDLQWTTVTHDKLGRITRVWQSDKVTEWQYDRPGALGSVASVTSTSQNTPNSRIYSEIYQYDPLGRLARTEIAFDGSSDAPKYRGTSSIEYDAEGRINAIIYPVGGSHETYRVTRSYDEDSGQLISVSDSRGASPLWKLMAADAEGRTTDVRLGNGVRERKEFSVGIGELTKHEIRNGAGKLSDTRYARDLVGNLTRRRDVVTGLDETFGYDAADHLIRVASGDSIITAEYDQAGRFIKKSDVGLYHYGCDGAPANGVCRITAENGTSETISYNDRGNVVKTRDYGVRYTSDGRVQRLEKMTATGPATSLYSEFDYGPTGMRIFSRERGCADDSCNIYRTKETLHLGNTDRITTIRGRSRLVTDRYYVAATNGVFLSVDYIDRTAAFGTDRQGPASVSAYLHRDHLGSISALTSQIGAVLQRFRFDPWGRAIGLRADNDNSFGSAAAWTRGFSGHDHIPQFALIHMNGRVYDSRLGVFLSVDPLTSDPTNSTDLNPYAYALNNPLTNRDISGYGFFRDVGRALGGLGRSIGKGVSDLAGNAFREVSQFIGKHWKEIVVVVVVVAVTVACVGACAPYVAVLAGAAGGATAGALYGGTVEDVLAGAITGAVFGAFSGGVAASGWSTAGKAAAYGTISGGRAAMSGGDFGRGFLIGAMSTGVDTQGLVSGDSWQNVSARVAIGAASGGTIAELSGDKFANGALSGAFHQLWQDARTQGWTKTETLMRYVGMYRAREATLVGLGAGAVLSGYAYLSSNPAIKFRLDKTGLFIFEGAGFEAGAGLTLGSTILYTPDAANDNLLNHEVRHVAQWGAYGSGGFLNEYRRQLDLYGYENGPFEAEGYRENAR